MLGPWYSVRVLIQYSVITFCATSMADTNIDVFNKQKEAEYDRQYAKKLTLRRLMSYIYAAPILDVSRSHTTTQHSR